MLRRLFKLWENNIPKITKDNPAHPYYIHPDRLKELQQKHDEIYIKMLKSEMKTLYFDMDNVLVDFQSGIDKLDEKTKKEYEGRLDEVPGIFSLMEPMPNAIESAHKLSNYYQVYIVSTAPWLNPSAWTDKINWIHKYFGKDESSIFYKRVIISHNKHLNEGEYLIDDRPNNGAENFKGEWIHFGSDKFPNWDSVVNYLIEM